MNDNIKEIRSGFLRWLGAGLAALTAAALIPETWLRGLGITWSSETIQSIRVCLCAVGIFGLGFLSGRWRRPTKAGASGTIYSSDDKRLLPVDGPLKFQWDGIKVLAAIRKTRNGAEAMTAVGFSKEDFLVHIRSLSESGLIETELIPYQHVNDGMGMDAWLTPKGLAALQQAEDRSQKTSGSP